MKTTIRFFVYDFCEDAQDYDIVEVDEYDFLQFDGAISYDRHTVFENGVNQVCLTKGLPEGQIMTLEQIKKDKRYTQALEYQGESKPLYTARFCDEFISCHKTRHDALVACLMAYNERMRDYL